MPAAPRSHRAKASSRKQRLVGGELERCIFCDQKGITRQGKRYKKLETMQLWYCPSCDRVFTPQRAKGKTYPLKIILESLMLYYRGETRAATVKKIRARFGVSLSPRTLSSWLAEYRDLTTYAKLRNDCLKEFRPYRIIRSTRLHHQQVYQYRVHQGKLSAALSLPKHKKLRAVGD